MEIENVSNAIKTAREEIADLRAAIRASGLFAPPSAILLERLSRIERATTPEQPDTLVQARAEVMAAADDGADCPCCGRLVKRYRHRLNSRQAAFLVRLVRASPASEYVHLRDVLAETETRGSHAEDYCYLERWGLIESARDDEARAKELALSPARKPGTTGYWRPTDLGRRFVDGRATVEAVLVMLCGEIEGFEGGQVRLKDVLGEKFDYATLMGAPAA